MGFSVTPGSKTPEPINMKLGVRNYVLDPTPTSKYGSDRAACGSRRMREISLFVTFFVFFSVSSPRLQVATVDRFSRSIRQTTRFRARKCPLGVSMTDFHTYLPFSPKFENWHYGLRQLRTAITRPFLKIEERCLHQSGCFRGRAI